jgi:hypothetical protein
MLSATSASSNTAVGTSALQSLTTGFVNTAVGREALSLTTGTGNIGIGFNAQVPNPASSNQIAIGTSAETMYIQGGFNYRVGNPITGTIILTGVLAQFYTVQNSTGLTITVTVPAAGPTYRGAIINFRRTVAASGNIQFLAASGPAIIPFNAVSAVGPVFLTTTQMSTTLICNGTTWFQMQTI